MTNIVYYTQDISKYTMMVTPTNLSWAELVVFSFRFSEIPAPKLKVRLFWIGVFELPGFGVLEISSVFNFSGRRFSSRLVSSLLTVAFKGNIEDSSHMAES